MFMFGRGSPPFASEIEWHIYGKIKVSRTSAWRLESATSKRAGGTPVDFFEKDVYGLRNIPLLWLSQSGLAEKIVGRYQESRVFESATRNVFV